jgi:putative transposase
MPNHVHAVLTLAADSKIMPFMLAWKKTSSYRIKRFYAQELSRYLDLCPAGCPVWQAGFYDHNLEGDEKVNEKIGYMHNNPVAAQLVSYTVNWRWSSARFYEMQEDVGVTITLCI